MSKVAEEIKEENVALNMALGRKHHNLCKQTKREKSETTAPALLLY